MQLHQYLHAIRDDLLLRHLHHQRLGQNALSGKRSGGSKRTPIQPCSLIPGYGRLKRCSFLLGYLYLAVLLADHRLQLQEFFAVVCRNITAVPVDFR
jgi:hypothetical protein